MVLGVVIVCHGCSLCGLRLAAGGVVGIVGQNVSFVEHLINPFAALATKPFISLRGFQFKAVHFNCQAAKITTSLAFIHRAKTLLIYQRHSRGEIIAVFSGKTQQAQSQ